MPAPIPVKLTPYDPLWAVAAEKEMERLRKFADGDWLQCHHIGSTAVPGIAAKGTLDLLATAPGLADLDGLRSTLQEGGYQWHGEFGFAGRRYLTKSHPLTGEREVNLHCYAIGDPAIARHLAFRDFLRMHPAIAAEYEQVKAHCASRHPYNSHAYTDCKSAWIRLVEAKALAFASQ